MDATPNYVFHFAKYKIKNVWNWFKGEVPVFYSEITGILAPQDTIRNGGLMTAFKGPHESIANIDFIN